jgi:hypothetical protein
MSSYRPRLVNASLADDLAIFPVVVLTGARQTGKKHPRTGRRARQGAFEKRGYRSHCREQSATSVQQHPPRRQT